MRIFRILLLTIIIFPFIAQGQNYTIEYGDDLKYSRIIPEAIDSIRTIEFWFKLDEDYTPAALSPQAIIQREDQTGQEQSEFGIGLVDFIGRKGHLEFHFNNNRIKSDQYYWRADNWYHVAGVIDPNEGMKLYIHGVEQLETDTFNAAIYPTIDTTFIGTWGFKRFRYFDGQIDEIRLWNRALSQDEIVENMCQGLDTNQVDALLAYYKFEKGKGNTAFDYSTNQYHLMVNNAAWADDNTCYVSNIESAISDNPLTILSGENHIQLELPTEVQGGNFELVLFDVTGRKILQEKVERNDNTILFPTTGLPKGPVILKLTSETGLYSAKTIIR